MWVSTTLRALLDRGTVLPAAAATLEARELWRRALPQPKARPAQARILYEAYREGRVFGGAGVSRDRLLLRWLLRKGECEHSAAEVARASEIVSRERLHAEVLPIVACGGAPRHSSLRGVCISVPWGSRPQLFHRASRTFFRRHFRNGTSRRRVVFLARIVEPATYGAAKRPPYPLASTARCCSAPLAIVRSTCTFLREARLAVAVRPKSELRGGDNADAAVLVELAPARG